MTGVEIQNGTKIGFRINPSSSIYAQKYFHATQPSEVEVWGTVTDIWNTKIPGQRACEVSFPNGETSYYGVKDNDQFVKG